MHIEILVEDSSGERLLECLLPQMLGEQGQTHTWRLHPYKGIGRYHREEKILSAVRYGQRDIQTK